VFITFKLIFGRFRGGCKPSCTTTNFISDHTTSKPGIWFATLYLANVRFIVAVPKNCKGILKTMKSLDFPPRDCPICGSQRKHLLFEQRFSALSKGSLLEGYDLMICDECGMAYADHIPDQSVFDNYYAEMSKYEYAHREGAESEFDAARFSQIADYLAGELPDRSCRILDIGCATAGQLAKLRSLGYENVTGLDPSPACSSLAKKFYDIPVFTGTLTDNDLPKHSFDLIILVGVLEHVREVADAVDKLGPLLSPNGMIFAEVPDGTAYADWPDAPYQEFSTEHINCFGPKSLENLMRSAGYELVKMDRPPRQFTKTTVMPSAAGLFRRTNSKLPLEKDTQSEPRLRVYIQQSAAVEERVSGLIDEIVRSEKPIVVWGVGTHTLHLLETTNFAKANIAAFVDVNTKYHGTELFGRPVISPQAMGQRPEEILISSLSFQNDIARMIKNDLNLPNQLILLYEESA
jgi:SAM-dependent methyltransferase